MKIVILDSYSINPGDLSWDPLKAFGNLYIYDRTSPEEVLERVTDADVIFVSKVKITDRIIANCKNLKFIGVTATGFDNIDLDSAKNHNVAVANVPAYSSDAVAQHTFSFILEITNNVGLYSQSVNKGKWYESKDFTFYEKPLINLTGKSLGIVGYGNIGKKVGQIAEAFGMKINIFSQNKEATIKSDIITLHCPATEENEGFINDEFITNMKDGAILINTARGALVNEYDLAKNLKSGKLLAAGIDVISEEPPRMHNPLIGLNNCYITPHIAWTPVETRQKVIDICTENLQEFLNGRSNNRIV